MAHPFPPKGVVTFPVWFITFITRKIKELCTHIDFILIYIYCIDFIHTYIYYIGFILIYIYYIGLNWLKLTNVVFVHIDDTSLTAWLTKSHLKQIQGLLCGSNNEIFIENIISYIVLLWYCLNICICWPSHIPHVMFQPNPPPTYAPSEDNIIYVQPLRKWFWLTPSPAPKLVKDHSFTIFGTFPNTLCPHLLSLWCAMENHDMWKV